MLEALVECCVNGIFDDDGTQLATYIFELLRLLIESVQHLIQPFMGRIIEAIDGHWDDLDAIKQVMALIESTHRVLSTDSFKNLLPELLPRMLDVISDQDDYIELEGLEKKLCVLDTLAKIGGTLGEYTRNVVPVLVRIIDRNIGETPESIREQKKCILVLMHVTKVNESYVTQFAARIIHVLSRQLLRTTTVVDKDLQKLAMGGLCCMVCRLGSKYIPYILPVKTTLLDATISPELENEYHSLVMKVVKGKTMPAEKDIGVDKSWTDVKTSLVLDSKEASLPSRVITESGWSDLKDAWSVNGRTTSGDWNEWMRRFSLELLRQSPSPIIHSCKNLAEVYQPLANELLNAAFMSVWAEMSKNNEDSIFETNDSSKDMAAALEKAIESPNIPNDILQKLLNMIEFVELHDKRLPIDIVKIGMQSRKAHAMAKSLRWREMEFSIRRNNEECIEALIAINNQLGLDDAAKGVLNCVEDMHDARGKWFAKQKAMEGKAAPAGIKVKPSWQEKLGNWKEALRLYEKHIEDGEDPAASEPEGAEKDRSMTITPDLSGGRARQSTVKFARASSAFQKTTSFDLDESYDAQHDDTDGDYDESLIEASLGRLRCFSALDKSDKVLNKGNPLWRDLKGLKKRFLQQAKSTTKAALTKEKIEKWIDEVEVLGAKAAWTLGKWGDLEQYMSGGRVGAGETNEPDDVTSFFGAVLAIKDNDWEKAQLCVDGAREKITPMLGNMLGDFSYSRAHRCMVTVQQLSELEEIIQHKRMIEQNELLAAELSDEERKAEERQSLDKLRKKWDARLEWVPQDSGLWRQILTLRSLILNPQDDLDAWLKYEKMCRRSGNLSLCHSSLKQLGVEHVLVKLDSEYVAHLKEMEDGSPAINGMNPMHSPINRLKLLRSMSSLDADTLGGNAMQGLSVDAPRVTTTNPKAQGEINPRVMYSIFKYMWACEHKDDALKGLEDYCHELKKSYEDMEVNGGRNSKNKNSTKQLLGRCMLKVAKWKVGMAETKKQSVDYDEIIKMQREAADLRPTYYKAWHSWALMNYQQIKPVASGAKKGEKGKPVTELNNYVVDAAKGFFRSLQLGKNRPMADILQDTLRLLTVWFNSGHRDDLNEEMENGLSTVSVDTWLFVIPQLIARIHTNFPKVNVLLHKLLTNVGKHHPQALIYPVTVASKTSSESRRTAATKIIGEMRKHDNNLVDEANLVSQEIIRLAITWHEAWHEGLEEASRLFFGEKDVDSMMSILLELHSQLESSAKAVLKDPTSADSLRTISFTHCYGRDIEEAHEWIKSYQKTKREADLHQAWDLYYHIFKRVTKQLNCLDKIELQHVSPMLLNAKDLKLAVPGTYKAHADVVRIGSFAPSMDVIVSKQRPRKMTVVGSDGVSYPFLLKGHEDLRQDERVMQLFGLINALLASDSRGSRSANAMSIRTYSVMPLSNNSGVIGWVPECDTLHSLVKQYREPRNIRMNCEHKLINGLAPAYDLLPKLNKIEVFEKVREQTRGDDLAKMLFLRSQNSEVWLSRRTNYTRSVAITSIAGYILGLGDRHPNNLMIDRKSGKMVHIDFGDCWEVCQTRAKYPESIPFRLTRMMVNAMEVTGIEGSFRSDCECVMRILRENRDSLTAMLEAFVHDPLISWRLLAEGKEVEGEGGGGEGDGAVNLVEGDDEDSEEEDDEEEEAKRMEREREEKKKGEEEKDKKPRRRPSTMKMASIANIFGGQDVAAVLEGEDEDEDEGENEELNDQAMKVKARIEEKLTGCETEFGANVPATVEVQVDKLIKMATDTGNLCVLFQGWCAFW
jgi:FKBP12-rapamycin complex-associated protein